MKTFGANVSMARTLSGIGDNPPLLRLSFGESLESCYPILETFLPDNVLSLSNTHQRRWYALRMAWYRGYRPQPTAIQFKISDQKASFNLRMDTKRGLI